MLSRGPNDQLNGCRGTLNGIVAGLVAWVFVCGAAYALWMLLR